MHRRGHIKHAFRQFDALAGALIDDLIEQFQRKIVRIARLLHLQLAQIQIATGGVSLLIEPLDNALYGVGGRPHLRFILEYHKEPVLQGIAGHTHADVLNVVLDHFTAIGVVLVLCVCA